LRVGFIVVPEKLLMCGIAGFVGVRPISPNTRRAMLSALAVRGPDAAHETAWNNSVPVNADQSADAALLHARLAIRDLRPVADQPMVSDDGQVWLCYNGEVYAWEAEAEALRAQGAVFRTTSDTEFILHAYRAFGFPALLDHLRGMFALALYDRRIGRLYLARDRLGLKPLIYGLRPDGLAFASTVRALLPWLPTEARAFSPEAIDAYLAHRYVPAPRTIFTHLQRLENGYYLSYDLASGHINKVRYWSLPESILPVSADEALDELRHAVDLRTVSDRPLGVFLSSGIDSSAIASILATSGHTNLGTYTAAFPGSSFDESSAAAEIATALGLKNLSIPIPSRLGDSFVRIIAAMDEPFADPSSFPTWFLARETVKHVTVVLGGDGGDEIFAGYKRHAKHMRTHWRAGLRLPVPPAAALAGKGWSKLSDEVRLPWEMAYALRFSGFTPAQRRYLATYPLTHDLWWRTTDNMPADPLERLLAMDFANTLPEYILRKADLCTMAHGLEMRAPLLDHRWLEKLAGVPASQRFTRPAKGLLAEVMKPLAPLHLFARKKRGFNPPLTSWLHNDLRARLDGLGERLHVHTGGQLRSDAIQALAVAYYDGASHLAEQLLQLYILDESLDQLDRLRKVT
jgi:asparagine synthase (glutamine-hydrolysing)